GKNGLSQLVDKCGDMTHIQPIPTAEKSPFRSNFYVRFAPNKKISHAIIKKNFQALAANHAIAVRLQNGVFTVGAYGMVVSDDATNPMTPKMVQLIPRDDLILVHDPSLDLRQFYKINGIDEIPTYHPVDGVTLPVCDMRHIINLAKKDAKKKIKKDAEGAAGGATNGSSNLSSSNPAPAQQRQRKSASELLAITKQCHAIQTTAHTFCMSDEFSADSNRLPVLILGSDTASVAEVHRLLGHQYQPLTRSDHDREAFFPAGHVLDHEMIAKLLAQLLESDETSLPENMDSLPLLQAMYLCSGHGIDQAFWNYLNAPPTKMLTSDSVDEFVRVTDTTTSCNYEMLQIRASIENGRKIFEQLKKMKSSLLATMAPLVATTRLITSIGSIKEVKYERGVGHQKQPVCIGSKRGIVPGEPTYFVQCRLNPIVSGGGTGSGQGTMMFFMSSSI